MARSGYNPAESSGVMLDLVIEGFRLYPTEDFSGTAPGEWREEMIQYPGFVDGKHDLMADWYASNRKNVEALRDPNKERLVGAIIGVFFTQEELYDFAYGKGTLHNGR